MLEVKNISVRVGNFTLKNVSLTIKDNECHVIIGPTGSGKTLLLESIIGFRRPLKGEILLDGKRIDNLSVEKRGFSYVPQDLALFPHLSVRDNIYYGLKIKGSKGGMDQNIADEIIEAVGIRHLINRSIKGLSGGEKQRVALVRAIAPGYRYLLLDEPLSALHEGLKHELWFLIKELQQRYGLTILMITHDIEEAFFLGDTISILIDGKLHQTGRKSDSLIPKSLEVAKFFGIRNLFETELIHTDTDTFTVYCEELNTKLSVRKDYGFLNSLTDHRLIAGIRSEDVMILREDLIRKDQDNMLTGSIKHVFYKGSYYIVTILVDNSTRLIDVELSDYAFRKLNISPGQRVYISLRSERMFLIPSAQT
ncbi:MAG: ABC transporter ATP-binding protein [Deferribacterales bacterium]